MGQVLPLLGEEVSESKVHPLRSMWFQKCCADGEIV